MSFVTTNNKAVAGTKPAPPFDGHQELTQAPEQPEFEECDNDKQFDADQFGREIIESNVLNVSKEQLENKGIVCNASPLSEPQPFGESEPMTHGSTAAAQPAPSSVTQQLQSQMSTLNVPVLLQFPLMSSSVLQQNLQLFQLMQLTSLEQQLLQPPPTHVPFAPFFPIINSFPPVLPVPPPATTDGSPVTNNQQPQPPTMTTTSTSHVRDTGTLYLSWRVDTYVRSNPKERPVYISEEKDSQQVSELGAKVVESFETEVKGEDDPNCIFNDFKQNLQMQCIDEQLIVCVLDDEAEAELDEEEREVMIHNTSLQDRISGNFVFIVSVPNKPEFKDRIPYQVHDLMTAEQIRAKYHIPPTWLPGPSRHLPSILECLRKVPFANGSRLKVFLNCSNKKKQKIVRMGLVSLTYCGQFCTLYNNIRQVIPVMLVQPTQYALEWRTFHRQPNSQIVSISLRYQGNDLWSIEHVENFDFGSVYFRHRLLLLPRNHAHSWSYEQVKRLAM